MKRKFYYGETLVRTSETRIYKFAIIDAAGKCKGCSESKTGIESLFRQVTKNGDGWNEIYKNVLNGTFKQKRGGWSEKDIRKWYPTEESLQSAITNYETYRSGLRIVELEMRI